MLKELYKKIFNGTATKQELIYVGYEMPILEFDIENSFDKYYNFQVLEKNIEISKVNNDFNYLSAWVSAFSRILMPTRYEELAKDQKVSLLDFFKCDVCDTISSLSFSEYINNGQSSFDEYKEILKISNNMYEYVRTNNNLVLYTKMKDGFADEFIVVNNDKKEFFGLFFDRNSYGEIENEQKVSEQEFNAVIVKLNNQGYKLVW